MSIESMHNMDADEHKDIHCENSNDKPKSEKIFDIEEYFILDRIRRKREQSKQRNFLLKFKERFFGK